jgi:hypothetical protein
LTSSPGSEYRFEFLPEVQQEAAKLPESVRLAVAELVVELHNNPYLGDLMDDRPPKVLEGCRKIRFDEAGRRGKPRYRFVYRKEPTDGAVGVMVVLAIGERREMIAYANAAARHVRREGRSQTRRDRP